jgi:hypothetical protein
MGIPIGCGTFLLLVLALSGGLTALRSPFASPVAPVAAGVETEVHGPPDVRQGGAGER